MLDHLENCLAFDYIAVDTEGFFDKGRLGTSVAHPGLISVYYPEGHLEDVNIDDEVREALAYTLKTVKYRIMHNAAHDLMWFPELFELPFVCTMIMGHMVDENLLSKSLDWMHKVYCNGEGKDRDPLMQKIIDTVGWYYVPYHMMNTYAGTDAQIDMELFMTLLPKYEKEFGPLWS
jgi:hypothetical protein